MLLHVRGAITCIFLTLGVQSVGAHSSSSACGKTAEGEEACQSSDDTTLLQGRVHIAMDTEAIPEENSGEIRRLVRGPFPKQRPMIEYFKNWALGSIDNHLARIIEDPVLEKDPALEDPVLEKDPALEEAEKQAMLNEQSAKRDISAALTAHQAAATLQSIRLADCAGSFYSPQYKVLSAEVPNTDGISHSLLVGTDGNLQYVAARRSDDGIIQAIVSDPPACHKQEPSFLERNDSSTPQDKLHVEYQKYGGSAQPIKENDTVVSDCVNKIIELASDCHTTYEVNVTSAAVRISDGVEVLIYALFCVSGECSKHNASCDFRTQASKQGAVLLQLQNTTAPNLMDEYYEVSLACMNKSKNKTFCECLNDSGTIVESSSTPLESVAFGELSLYKGFEHVNDDLPQLDLIAAGFNDLLEDLPEDVDIREDDRECFPSLPSKAIGSETVRNQGTCGSCWAFAAATVTMHTLCISNAGESEDFFSPEDRYEISVQELMSCPIDGQPNLGCGGGYMAAVNSGFVANGLARERNNLYKCGGGNPKKHFEQRKPDCARPPWGGTCTGQPVKKWVWGGVLGVDGENDMRTVLSKGFSLYGTLSVYMDFMRLRGDGIVQTTSGRKLGGHAISIIGYGKQSSTKYWLIQNSWGTDGWGVNGFGKVLRGTNFCGIESGAYMVRAWVEGARKKAPPPCTDSKTGSGLSRDGRSPFASCASVKKYCSYSQFKKILQSRCPVTCGTCGPSFDDGKTGAEDEEEEEGKEKNKTKEDQKSACSPKTWFIVFIGIAFAHLALYF